MLILTRKVDQGIVISGNITVRVLGVDRDRVKIGISAPMDVTVLRQELIDKDRAQAEQNNEGANSTNSASATRRPAANDS